MSLSEVSRLSSSGKIGSSGEIFGGYFPVVSPLVIEISFSFPFLISSSISSYLFFPFSSWRSLRSSVLPSVFSLAYRLWLDSPLWGELGGLSLELEDVSPCSCGGFVDVFLVVFFPFWLLPMIFLLGFFAFLFEKREDRDMIF